jgi:hypothetical protein
VSFAERTHSAAQRPGEALARFWEARGHLVLDVAGAYWVPFSRRMHASVPWQRTLDPDPEPLVAALREHRLLGVRYPSAHDTGVRTAVYVCPVSSYGLARVQRKRRSQVRRGLERCELRAVQPDELLRDGLELNRDTMRRQRRFDPEFGDAARWGRFVRAACSTPGISVHGAFTSGRLSAYQIACRDGAWVHHLYKMHRTADLPTHGGTALEFRMLELAALDPGIEAVTTGVAALFRGDSLHQVKTDLGYGLLQIHLGVQLHPAVDRLAKSTAGQLLSAATPALGAKAHAQATAALLRAAVGTHRSRG